MFKARFILASVLCLASIAAAQDQSLRTFKRLQLSDQFWSEGAYAGDFNRDGKMDAVSGPFWYEGPGFKSRHEYRPATNTWKLKLGPMTEVTVPGWQGALGKANDYSDNFLTFVHDLNGDGWDDIIIYGFPGKEVPWYENPQGRKNPDGSGLWRRHVILDVLDNESPTWGDLTGDGKPEIICNSGGYLGYATADWSDPTRPWKFHRVSPKGAWQRYTHGLGFGDVNGDGRVDLLEANGWWEQPASLAGDPEWKHHAFPFAPNTGSCQMYACDFNGDGLNDVLTCLAPHGYGLAWYEQTREDGRLTFKQDLIMGKRPEDNKYGVKFSQPHAIDLVDMDGDGLKDFVCGKRFWAHGPSGDDEPNAPAVLYWFKTVRHPDRSVEFIPYLVDNDSGVGTQVLATDMNGDRQPDIVVGNKKGTFVFLQEVRKASREEWEKAQPKPLAR
jgi:hypothetical protein